MSRAKSSASRIFHRYQIFFGVAFFLVTVQMYMGYSFYRLSREDLETAEENWKKRTTKSHVHPVTDSNEESLHHERPPDLRNRPPDVFQRPPDVPKAQNSVPGHKLTDRNTSHVRLKPEPHLPPREPRFILDSPPQQNQELPKPYKLPRKGYNPTCEITENHYKEAYSAIQRASTVACKQEISDVVCDQKHGKLFRGNELPNYCPLRTDRRGELIGCYKDNKDKRLLADLSKTFPTENTRDKCILLCLQAGFEFAGLEWGIECFCGETFKEKKATQLEEEVCNTPCSGDPSLTCGGYNSISIYTTGAGARKFNYPLLVKAEDVPEDALPVRIAFILTLNGRAIRQVTRLIKSLYHRDHYILIHVDARQEYLHREVTRITSNYDNIRMMPYRYATIWGGANLSTMLLKCIEYLLSDTDWDWHFIINLSESDYPVRPIEQLFAFLTVNRGLNFLKSHGKDTPRFIQKQGLARTFVQCDNHMWRVGERTLPKGIRIDGGSDWVALNREFCEYLVTSTDELIQGLREYWKYTLLPGESFWHTVLQNSRFCEAYGNNNLHVVNWMRKKGCKCQYKSIVDWCGCSPNDFLDGDMPKLMNLYEKQKVVFFARKFEPIVSQSIINQLDAFLYGAYPEGTAGLSSYWESRYSWEDRTVSLSDAHATFHCTWARAITSYVRAITAGKCRLDVQDVLDVHVYKHMDTFQGLLTKLSVVDPTSNTSHLLEGLLQYKPMVQMYGNNQAVTRLSNLEVGVNFDPKEEFFRSFGNVMGPHTTFSVVLHWLAGLALRVTVSVIDPAQVIANSFEIDVDKPAAAIQLVMDLAQPLRPGIWTVKLQHQWTIIAETHFLITPYSMYGGRSITDAEAKRLHNGPPKGVYKEGDHARLSHLLDLDDVPLAQSTADRNGRRTGTLLNDWIDDLTSKFWTVGAVCSESHDLQCGSLPLCGATSWSSLSPDPKSDLGPIDKITGRMR